MTLRDDLDGLPDDALVPVGWIRDRLSDDRAVGGPVADLTVQEVAEELDRAPSTVRGWLGSGDLEGYRLRGREWRVPREALVAFLDEERGGGREEGSADLGSWRAAAGGGRG